MIFVSSKVSDGNMDFRFQETNVVSENRKRFFRKLKINLKDVVEVTQVHDNEVLLAENINYPNTKADGLLTNNPNFYLMINVADCMAIGFHDSKHNAIGLIHAGFRGLENGIIKKVVEAMKQNFKTNSSDLIVKINPSIGPCHYRLDLWKKAEKQLTDYGILKENIDNPKICTYESSNYFSHRRSNDLDEEEGRFVTILGLKNAH